ncbi:hypothetical protein [Fluviispira multicolorata]|uniref:Uncharacterized protein n=1 Tax=Fluviispira multicolorata TaxID=2654512 RepID=A0A833N466_9BACT|nr:hypothetical protein [Fluviispira multicolorata]KAB8029956.1 hypothetical protein GCL57_10495 [Fluviispira multicolorata]
MNMKISKDIINENKSLNKANNAQQEDVQNLWNQYQKQLNKKKVGSAIFVTIFLFIVILLVFIGLYIVMSTNSPLSGS